MKIDVVHLGVLTVLFLILGCNSNSPHLKGLIGKEYQTLTEFDVMKGYVEREGMLLESFNDNEYALSQYVNGPSNVIAFEKVLRRENGTVNYLLMDVLEINGIRNNRQVSCGLCRLNNNSDKDIIAVYQDKTDTTHFCSKIKKAWRANRKTKKIEQIDTNGIDCLSEG
jgi:hypothetical protein